MGGYKDQITSLFKKKDYSEPKPVKTVYGNKQSEENMAKSIRSLFKLKKENE